LKISNNKEKFLSSKWL